MEQNEPSDPKGGIRLSREVLEALPPLSREDGAIKAMVEGILVAPDLLQRGRALLAVGDKYQPLVVLVSVRQHELWRLT